MDRHTPTVSELVRRAAETADPSGRDPSVARLQEQLEDHDEPVTAVENLEERLALAADRDPNELIQLEVRSQWHGDPPDYVADWLAAR